MKTTKSFVVNEEKCERSLLNDLKHQKAKSQPFKRAVEKLAYEKGISKAKAQN